MVDGRDQTPFICRTEASGLGAPLDADCSVETRYEYLKNMGGMFVALPDPAMVPGDVQKVAPGNGQCGTRARDRDRRAGRAIDLLCVRLPACPE